MRSHVPSFELTATRHLTEALSLLREGFRPIAGATDVMVLFEAGKLAHKKWISIRDIAELRFIDVDPDYVTLGALTTYTDVRRSAILAAEFPLMTRSRRAHRRHRDAEPGHHRRKHRERVTRRRHASRAARL